MNYHLPTSIDHALEISRTSGGDFSYIAGGTDQMVQRSQGNNSSKHLIDISRVESLRSIATTPEVRIGAGVTLSTIGRNAELAKRFPALVNAARSVASPLIRTAATIGGNLLCENRCIFFDQSEFWREAVGFCLKCGGDACIATSGTKNCYSVCISDIAPVLICLDARIEYIDGTGESSVTVEQLYSGDGNLPRALPKEALVTTIVIPAENEGAMTFRKLRARESVDFTNLTMAMRHTADELIVALTGVAARPVSIRTTPTADADSIVAQLTKASTIINNLPYPRLYRKEMISVYIREGLSECKSQVGS